MTLNISIFLGETQCRHPQLIYDFIKNIYQSLIYPKKLVGLKV